ncbi:hypothetical protein ACFVQ0_24600, partial [Streptomyces sp. NPDC057900]|uniref:hypothetical protein n=1 Tax=Streptomyces sp. NPDC057900 TaxID=3346274 RepID=UPI0036E1F6F6
PKQVGVSTYLALTFGTLLSSQGTDASFVLTLRTFSGAFLRALPFGLAFPTLSDSFVSDSRSKRASQFRFPGIRFRVSLSGESDSIRPFLSH